MRARRKSFWILALVALGLVVVPAVSGAPAARAAAASQSQNWFGYAQNVLATGSVVTQVSATWHVPTVQQRVAGEAESSAVWTGVGGGCLGQDCSSGATDETLIQAGTEQDVAANGTTSYSAWWEAVPAPEVIFSGLSISPGDGIRVTVAQTGPEIWTITFDDITQGVSRSANATVPYTSDYSTAEWVAETPLVLGVGAGIAALPMMSPVTIQNAQINGNTPHLQYPTQAIDLVDGNGQVVASPSPPTGARRDRFNVCAAPTCAPPR